MLGYLRSGNKRAKMIWWILIVFTVVSFLIGFSFFGGMGDPSSQARMSGHVGMVNGEKVTIPEWQAALEEARLAYRQRFGADPQDRDIKAVEQQAWRGLVNEKMFAQVAADAGLKATDAEVVVAMRTNPPSVLLASPAFQTDGQFDPAKYQQQLANPANNWSAFEDLVRRQLPVRKLQERLLASIKLSQPELRQAFHDRQDQWHATIVTVPAADSGRSAGTEAELQKVYEQYKTRMAVPARTQLEVIVVPKQFGDDEVKAAMDLAKSLFDRANAGEDFAQLARDHSEGPNSERGGMIDRWLSPNELGPMIAAAVRARPLGSVIEPVREGGRVLLLKIMDPAQDTSSTKTPPPFPDAVKLSQIVIKIRPATEALRTQLKDVQAITARAKAVGLSRAATEKGLSSMKTGLYDQNNAPPQLFSVPEAADWGLSAKKGEVSPVFEGQDEFVVAQVALQHQAGIPSREEVGEQLKMIADQEVRVDLAKPRADQFVAALRAGQGLEQAATAMGLSALPLVFSRAQPDPRLAASPELLGMLLGAPPARVIGPVRGSAGWLFGRLDRVVVASDSLMNDQVRGQITTQVLQERQRRFFDAYVEKLRAKAEIKDLRGGGSF